jgi:glycine/D-amino acid oxidase-like deaminating enzyme
MTDEILTKLRDALEALGETDEISRADVLITAAIAGVERVAAERDVFMASNAGLTTDALALRAERDAAIAERDGLRSVMQDIKDETTGWAHCVASSALSRQGLLDNSTRAALSAAEAARVEGEVCGACGKPWTGEKCGQAEKGWPHPVCNPVAAIRARIKEGPSE